jgi:hypothetical protein
MKQEFLKDVADTIRVTVYQNNRPIVPSSATITLYKAGSTSELQASTAATVDATTGELTYALTATHTAAIGTNYKAKWAYVVGATTYYEEQLFDVVLSKLSIPIIDDDLFNELDSLRDVNIQASGTATAGATGTLTDTNNRKESDDYWTGGKIEIMNGTGANQVRDITDFVQSTSVISVSPNWATTPDTTSVYRVIRGYTKKIQQSFDKICQMIYNKGNRPALIIESSQIKVAMIYLTVHFICLDLMKDEGDKWDRLSTRYWDLFSTEFGQMKLDYDVDESGTITGDEEQRDTTSLRFYRS